MTTLIANRNTITLVCYLAQTKTVIQLYNWPILTNRNTITLVRYLAQSKTETLHYKLLQLYVQNHSLSESFSAECYMLWPLLPKFLIFYFVDVLHDHLFTSLLRTTETYRINLQYGLL